MRFKSAFSLWTVTFALAACQQEQTTEHASQRPYQGYDAFSERFRSPEVLCGTNKDCLASPLIASTREELAWLRSHGYPSLIQLRKLRAKSTIALEEEVQRGSANAMIVLGSRLIGENHSNAGLEQMMQAARNGSVYALYELSNAHARGPAVGDQLEAAALLRAAELRGDWKAAGAFSRRFPTVGRFERALVEARAEFLVREIWGDKRAEPRPSQ